jgi:hypothetical protein
MTGSVEHQLAAELHTATNRLCALAPIPTGWAEGAARVTTHALATNPRTAVAVIDALWPHTNPPAEWWTTPLGQTCANHLDNQQPHSWTHATAALVLGVTRGTVAQLVSRGKIPKHPAGGVCPAGVIRYANTRCFGRGE